MKKNDSTFNECLDIWYKWYVKQTNIKPKIDGSQGKALKQIIKYFELNYSNYTPQKCLSTLLLNWDRLRPFNQQFKEIRSINSQLTNLLDDIQNGKNTSKNQQLSDKLANENRQIRESGTAFD